MSTRRHLNSQKLYPPSLEFPAKIPIFSGAYDCISNMPDSFDFRGGDGYNYLVVKQLPQFYRNWKNLIESLK